MGSNVGQEVTGPEAKQEPTKTIAKVAIRLHGFRKRFEIGLRSIDLGMVGFPKFTASTSDKGTSSLSLPASCGAFKSASSICVLVSLGIGLAFY